MIDLPFNFKVKDDALVEIRLDKNLNLTAKYVKIYKSDYISSIYAKLDLNNNVTEIYPYFINDDIISSLRELTRPIPYYNMELKDEQPFLSYDLKNCPDEIYFPNRDKKELLKYKLDKLDSKYYQFDTMEEFKQSDFYKDYNFTGKFPEPNYIITRVKKDADSAIVLGYYNINKNYKKIKRKYFKNI